MENARAELWPVPYINSLEGALRPGQTIVITGAATGNQFDVSLLTGQNLEKDDTALHISLSQMPNAISLCSLVNGKWLEVEGPAIVNPLQTMQPFELRIRATDKHLSVFLNQLSLAHVVHVVPLNFITHLAITNDIALHCVRITRKHYALPYRKTLVGGFLPGMRVFISGTASKLGSGFEIELKTRRGDAAFHLNVNLQENVVATYIHGLISGPQEVKTALSKSTVTPGEPFDVIIRNEWDFEVYINGERIADVSHRLDTSFLTELFIKGGLELEGVHVAKK